MIDQFLVTYDSITKPAI